MEVIKDVFVPMRDGIELAVDIYRPEAQGRYPAVLQRTPYLKSGTVTGRRGADGLPATSPVGAMAVTTVTATAKALVDKGYVVVVSDTRGTGFSQGVYDYYNFEGGPWDGYDTIEWLAEQAWCDGNVGIMGASAAAIFCYLAALTHPPHLKAMAANMHPNDFYFDQWFVGGVFRYENRIGWSTGMIPRMSPQDPGERGSHNYEKKLQVYRERYYQYYERMAQGKNPINLDWLTEMFQHPTYDDFWKARSFAHRLGEVDTPTLHGGVLFDHFGRGTVMAHEGLSATKRLFMSPGALVPGAVDPEGGYQGLLASWFDHFLKGVENGVTEGPAARYYLMGEDRWVDAPEWPVPVREERLHLSGDRSLREAPPTSEQSDTATHDPAKPNPTPRNPADQRPRGSTLSYMSAPLEADLTVVGRPSVRLFASSDASDVDWVVRLCDVFPDGRAQLLNMGALKASHRVSHEAPEDLEPGRIYQFDIEIWPVANAFTAGHRIRLDVSTSDFPFFEPNPVPSTSQVFHDEGHPSCLVLPVPIGS
jgi:hypothetical protein